MDQQIQVKTPDYKQIFWDILNLKYPERKEELTPILEKQNLSAVDVLEINQKIFGSYRKNQLVNQRYRAYNKSDILQILDYQQKHKLNNSQLAKHFKISRNTIAKWRKMFLT